MDFDLERFIKAQDAHGTYDDAIHELEEGEKQSHWMWFVFPQMKGLGRSEMAQKYGISSVYEAHAYLNHLELRERLYNAVNVLNDNNYGKEIESVLGTTDAMKLKSCLTLFDAIEPDSVFDKGLRYFFNEERDESTLKMIGKNLRILDEDVWEEYNSSFVERAYFDDYCHEANGLSAESRIATFLELKRRGHKIITLTWHYLLAHNDLFDNYRTSNTETALTNVGFNFLASLIKWLDEESDKSPSTQLKTLFPLKFFQYKKGMTWETTAYRLDALMDFALSDSHLSKYCDNLISNHSTLTK